MRRRWPLLLAVPLARALALAGPATAQDEPSSVPAAVVQPLGEEPPVVVPYRELVGAADARNLNAAVVDTTGYWVAAIDREGRVIAAKIPRPRPGQDFATATAAAPVAPAAERAAASKELPGAFDLAARLRADGVAVLGPAQVAAESGSGLSSVMRFLLLPLGVALVFVIGGVAELREVVVFLKEPERFRRVGARMPRGVVLHGPPGTGKTLLAKAVAGESGVPFFALSGSDFVDTFVGVGASRVRDLFPQARRSETGAIIFLDELDAIGRARGAGTSGADSEREGTLNQLLGELDGFDGRERVVVVRRRAARGPPRRARRPRDGVAGPRAGRPLRDRGGAGGGDRRRAAPAGAGRRPAGDSRPSRGRPPRPHPGRAARGPVTAPRPRRLGLPSLRRRPRIRASAEAAATTVVAFRLPRRRRARHRRPAGTA